VFNEGFLAPVNFFMEAVNEPTMRRNVTDVCPVQVKMASITDSQLVGKMCPEGHFYPLNGLKNEESEFSVKDIKIKYSVKGCTFLKDVVWSIVFFFEGNPIAA